MILPVWRIRHFLLHSFFIGSRYKITMWGVTRKSPFVHYIYEIQFRIRLSSQVLTCRLSQQVFRIRTIRMTVPFPKNGLDPESGSNVSDPWIKCFGSVCKKIHRKQKSLFFKPNINHCSSSGWIRYFSPIRSRTLKSRSVLF